jgi:hypothetical protein
MYAIHLPGRPATVGLALALAMAATRFHHFGAATYLPDASVAVFLLGGFYLRRWAVFVAFVAEAALIDYLAIAHGGVSDWCVTPAYPFLIPAYACAWVAGAWYARRFLPDWRTVAQLSGALIAGVSAWFLISNASFYLFSGYFPEVSWTEYAARVAKYFAPYLGVACAYVALAAIVHALAASTVRASQRA